jgi:hypothetical protein
MAFYVVTKVIFMILAVKLHKGALGRAFALLGF